MNQLNLIAVPNGFYSLEEALQEPTIQQAAQMLKPLEGTTTSKIKALRILVLKKIILNN